MCSPIDELLKSLTIASFYQANKWVCIKCLQLHDIELEDVPHVSLHPLFRFGPCPQADARRLRAGPSMSIYAPDYHHVQLSLKYSRLRKHLTEMQQEYFKRLMTPYCMSNFHDTLDALYIVTPRVVRGRYLMRCAWTFRPRAVDLSYEAIGYISICRHMQIFSGGNSLSDALCKSWRWETNFIGGCRYCATQFEAHSNRGRKPFIKLICYQDFRPERSMPGRNWNAIAGLSLLHIGRERRAKMGERGVSESINHLWEQPVSCEFLRRMLEPSSKCLVINPVARTTQVGSGRIEAPPPDRILEGTICVRFVRRR